MNLELFFSLVTIHLFCDFVIQINKIVNLRYSSVLKNRLKGNIYHSAIHFTVSFFLTSWLYSYSFKYILLLLFISVVHGLIDFTKGSIIAGKPDLKNNILLFLSDQFLHIIILFIFSGFISFNFQYKPTNIFTFGNSIYFWVNRVTAITYTQKLLLALGIMVASLWGVGVFIRMFIAGLKKKTGNEKNVDNHIKSIALNTNQATPDGGFIIGIMERFFIICSIVFNMTQIIGFLLATKSIARFKKFDDDCFVENFIIGSFISFSSAIVAGVIIKALNII